ncbi:MAG: hypothetical protein VXY99_07330, partial [Pseudomonadota bacterium]|nr:hypothetical protein [Pseudomonadota bacterium]
MEQDRRWQRPGPVSGTLLHPRGRPAKQQSAPSQTLPSLATSITAPTPHAKEATGPMDSMMPHPEPSVLPLSATETLTTPQVVLSHPRSAQPCAEHQAVRAATMHIPMEEAHATYLAALRCMAARRSSAPLQPGLYSSSTLAIQPQQPQQLDAQIHSAHIGHQV